MYGFSEPGVDGEGVFFRNSRVPFRDITDGLSHTIPVEKKSHRLGEATLTGSVTGALLAGDPSDGIGQMVPEHGSGMTLGHVGERRSPGGSSLRRKSVLQQTLRKRRPVSVR